MEVKINGYDEEERQQREFDEAEKYRTGPFAEYDRNMHAYRTATERFTADRRAYEANLRHYEEAVANHNAAIRSYEAQWQEYEEACRRVNEQQYYHDCQEEEDDEVERAYHAEVERRRIRQSDNASRYRGERLEIAAQLEASHIPQVITMMEDLWGQFDGNDFYVTVPGMDEPAELVGFLLSLPPCSDGLERWSVALECSEGYPAVSLRVPAVAWSVNAVPPPPIGRKEWLDALCALEDQTAVVRSTSGKGARPHVHLVRIADVPDALPDHSPLLQEFTRRSFRENGLPPDIVAATFEMRTGDIRKMTAGYVGADPPQRGDGRGGRPPRSQSAPQCDAEPPATQAPMPLPAPVQETPSTRPDDKDSDDGSF